MSAKHTFYLGTIEGEKYTGIIVSPTPIDDLGGEEIDSETLIIWDYMGQKIKNDNPAHIEVFKLWVRNILSKTGATVLIE